MENKIKKGRYTFSAICKGYGSEQRSALCPFEAGCIYFQTGLDVHGGEVRWFNEKAAWDRPFKDGQCYRLSAIVTPEGTLQRVKSI